MSREPEVITTDEYPTRYVAWDNPRKWVEHAHPEDRGGFEWAVYADEMINADAPHLKDGIYIEIIRYQNKGWLADCSFTIPNAARRQGGIKDMFRTYAEAKGAALRWLPTAEAVCSK